MHTEGERACVSSSCTILNDATIFDLSQPKLLTDSIEFNSVDIGIALDDDDDDNDNERL